MQVGPGDTFDRYTIEALIGQGGMGRVYRAHDGRLRRRVALKILRLDRLDDAAAAVPRLLREARAAAALDHPGSVAIFDVGEVSGVPFIAMEYVIGRSLREFVGDPAVALADRLRWLREVARVLAVAHAAGLIHRDVKPENVMVRGDGAVKVLDFGIARQIDEDDDGTPAALWADDTDATTLEESEICGTPSYMAPEQVQGRSVDARADQFAWGVLAYELLSGALPWRSVHEGVATMVAVVTERQARLSPLLGVLPHVAAAVDRALEKDPERRFATMTELLAALDPGGSRPSRRSVSSAGASFAADGTQFVGRDAELARLRAWLVEGKRLVTIVGPPGVGKTRLARVAAQELAPGFAGRLWFVDLSEAETVADVVHAATRALGLSMSIEVGAHASIEPLAGLLAGFGRAAIVFDGIDRIAARHAAAIGRLLERAPQLCALVTSRERLLLRVEHVLELGPLEFPAAGDPASEQVAAVSLFLDRARAVRPEYRCDAPELVRVGELVRLLDGLPLAIELAAARMTVLDVRGLLDRLGRRGGGVGRVDAAIEASWALLDAVERSALAQCSVFRGGFDLDAAEAVLELDAADVPDVLGRLRDRSLLAASESAASGKLRFFLYRSIRDFAAAKLDEAAVRAASLRHARWYVTRGRVFADAVGETGSAAALATLALERENLRAIAERMGPGAEDLELLGHALLAQGPLDHAEGSLADHLAALGRVLERPIASAELRARLVVARGRALLSLGRPADAIRGLASAHDGAGEPDAEALLVAACAHASLGAAGSARERALAARASAARTRQPLVEARADAVLAALERDAGRLAEAAELYQRARLGFRAVGAQVDEGQAALELGLVRAALGSTEDAAQLVAEATLRLAGAADPRLHAAARAAFAGIALDLGRCAEARAAGEEALASQRQLGDRNGEAATLVRLAWAHLDDEDPERAETEARTALALAASERLQALLRWTLALAAWDRGAGEVAGEHARQAALGARGAGDRLAEGLFAASLGAIEASRGRSTEAAQAFDEARRAHDGPSSAPYVEAATLARAFGELRRARDLAGRSHTHGAAEQLARVRTTLARVLAPVGGAPLVRCSFVVRALARRLYRALSPADRLRTWAEAHDPDRRALLLDVAARAFRPPGADAWIEVAERLRLRLLAALVEQRLRGAAADLSVGALVEILWPGEHVPSDSAEDRVEQEVAALRASGLADLVHRSPAGYGLAPSLAVLEIPRTL